jgi:hypothetical protein
MPVNCRLNCGLNCSRKVGSMQKHRPQFGATILALTGKKREAHDHTLRPANSAYSVSSLPLVCTYRE